MGLLSNFFKVRPERKKQFPPIPLWRPDLSIDHGRILEIVKFYTGQKLQLAVFKYGTVMFFAAPVDDIEQAAKSNLHKIYYAHPDFKTVTMDDGNYLIEYTQPGFTVVFKDELDNNWDYIEKHHEQGVCTDEILINSKSQANVFDTIGKICLFGRAKMFMDAQEPEVVNIFDPIRG